MTRGKLAGLLLTILAALAVSGTSISARIEAQRFASQGGHPKPTGVFVAQGGHPKPTVTLASQGGHPKPTVA